jgi:predicted TPR repeat methyltransferase
MTTPSVSEQELQDGDRDRLGARARRFFDDLWTQGDYWKLETAEFDQRRHARSLQLLEDRRYARALEIGCGAGAFTSRLATVCDRITALDVSSAAIASARERGIDPGVVEFREANIMDMAPETEGPWDLIVMSETIYYLGWLYSFFDVSWLAHRLLTAVAPGGRFLMVNTLGESVGYLLRPWLICTYRDLFLNVGFQGDHEEVFRGAKDGVQLEALITVLQRPVRDRPDDQRAE